MKVLLLMTVIMTSFALRVNNLIPAEQLKLLPVSAPKKENGNTTNTMFLQLSANPDVTCEFTIDNYVHKVYLDGEDKTSQVNGNLNGWTAKKTIVFSSSVRTIAVFGRDAEAGCVNGGFAIKCSSVSDPAWNGLVSDLTWKVEGKTNDANVATACPAGWADASYDDSSWKNARWGSTKYADGVIGVPDICGDGNSWCFRKTVKATSVATTEAATEEPSSTKAGTRSPDAINLDFSKLVHEKFSQEAAHGTWNLHLNLDTDPCSLLTCKAETQCHAVGKCTKEGGGVCTTPFLAKDTECDDQDKLTVSDVCDGAGLCAGINIGMGCLEMRFDASQFKEGYSVQKWTDLAKKKHDATAHGTVPKVLMDKTDKPRPYVPVQRGKWWNVEGNTFLKTIVSVFRQGDGKTKWEGHGATLARRSGRPSNWLFENGHDYLHGNELPDRAWKNGKAIVKPFRMSPINKFFVLVIEVNDRNKGAAAYYLGRGDADTSRVDLQEVMGYDRKLTDVERKQVEAYLKKKWNIEE